MDNAVAVKAYKLKRHYNAGGLVVPALDGVDFNIFRGEFVSLVGPSGSGKSTLLNLIGALDRPSEGDLSIDGTSLTDSTDDERARLRRDRLGFVFQSFNLLPTLTSVENVETPMILAGASKAERHVRACELLNSVGLGHRAKHHPNELSGGEKQRVAIARALANNPRILLADEPTGSLDSKSGASILDILCELVAAKQLTLVMVTHDLSIANRADRVIHLQDGRIRLVEESLKSKVASPQ
jgi:putative ABC transport system ATP-binding protein